MSADPDLVDAIISAGALVGGGLIMCGAAVSHAAPLGISCLSADIHVIVAPGATPSYPRRLAPSVPV